ncbi:hypothetical protein [Psychrobacter pygoscelis]|uniref:hypothetical protein n=1 Tax=Psychrobacter pygoscelis TaxID=2488563 RepID=UPI00103E1CAB|nr:hypothetical protein [Psychrobacter pygoscelis]
MQDLFIKLVQVYRNSEGLAHSDTVSYCISDKCSLDLITAVTNTEIFEDTSIFIETGEAKIGEKIKLHIGPPQPQLGRLHRTFQDFIKADFRSIFSTSNINEVPYYVADIDYCSQDSTEPKLILSYNVIKKLLISLERISAYLDRTNKKLIFVGKQTVEMSYDVGDSSIRFETTLREYANVNQNNIVLINKLCEWMEDESTSRHIDQKRSILTTVLSDIFPSNVDFLEFLSNIEFIDKSVRGQYGIYLENFKYEKFVKKLEDNSEKFVNRVNDSISKVLSQVLALPIAAAVPVILKGELATNQWVVYTSLLAYSIICYFALDSQKTVLEHIKNEVKNFDKADKLPTSMLDQWNSEKTKILLLADKQSYLYWTMFYITCAVMVYSVFQLCNSIPILKSF